MNDDLHDVPLVSVIVPVRDRADSLARCLVSVQRQTLSRFEVIVVENESSDPQAISSVVSNLADGRFHVIHLPVCSNANVARNVGRRAARGRFVAFLDSDDEWYPDHLQTAVSAIGASTASFFFASMDIDDGHSVWSKHARPLHPGEDPSAYLFGRHKAFASTIGFVHRNDIDEWWDESLARHQDFDYFIRICRKYEAVVSAVPSARIHWARGERRGYDRSSMIGFYRKHAETFAPGIRLRFCWDKIKLAIKRRDPPLGTVFLLEAGRAALSALKGRSA
jgi:glycosyltransferase involved in cell wall biosynthesis